MVIDLTDPNRPRFTLQELRDVLQERNKLKSQLLVVQEELQCYKRWGSAAWGLRRRSRPCLEFLVMLRICSYDHSTNLLKIYYMPDTIPGPGDLAVNTIKSI